MQISLITASDSGFKARLYQFKTLNLYDKVGLLIDGRAYYVSPSKGVAIGLVEKEFPEINELIDFEVTETQAHFIKTFISLKVGEAFNTKVYGNREYTNFSHKHTGVDLVVLALYGAGVLSYLPAGRTHVTDLTDIALYEL